MTIAELGLKVDTSEAVAKIDALTEAANRATEALKAFAEAYEAVGNKAVILNVEADIERGARRTDHRFRF